MEKEFIPYGEALALKELGFNEPCFSAYRNTDGEEILMGLDKWTNSGKENTHNGYCSAPLCQQAFRWFREKHEIAAEVSISANHRNDIDKWMFSITYLSRNTYSHSTITYKTYEEAELECLKKLIEIVKHGT